MKLDRIMNAIRVKRYQKVLDEENRNFEKETKEMTAMKVVKMDKETVIKMVETEIKKLKEIDDFWGDHMPMMAMEEAGEFIQAVSKLERNLKDVDDDPDRDYLIEVAECNLIEEMGDMIISIGVLMSRYDIPVKYVMHRINDKLGKEY